VTLHGLVTEQSLQGRTMKGLLLIAFRSSMKATGSFASAFVVHSEGMRKTAEDQYGLHDVFVIPLGSVLVSAVAGGRVSSHHVVFFGFIRPEKGLQHLIGAIGTLREKVPDIRLTIAGSVVHERERGYLRGLRERVHTEALTDHVRFLTEFLSDEEIAELMRGAAVFALPYTDQFVEVSAIVHDVAGYGVPLVCSRTPRFSELVDGVDCLKVAPVSSEIARAILRILSEPNLATKLGEGLLRRSQTVTWDVVAAEHLELYRQVLRLPSPAKPPPD